MLAGAFVAWGAATMALSLSAVRYGVALDLGNRGQSELPGMASGDESVSVNIQQQQLVGGWGGGSCVSNVGSGAETVGDRKAATGKTTRSAERPQSGVAGGCAGCQVGRNAGVMADSTSPRVDRGAFPCTRRASSSRRSATLLTRTDFG